MGTVSRVRRSSTSGSPTRLAAAVVVLLGGLVGSAVLTSPASAAGGPLGWSTPTQVDHQAPYNFGLNLAGVSCPSTSLCVAVDDAGDVLTSTDPAGGAGAWTVTDVDGSHALSGVSCPSTSLCVAVDSAGDVLSSTDPTGGGAAWNVVNVIEDDRIVGVSCSSTSLCVAVDVDGNVLASSDPTGGAGDWSSTEVVSGNLLSVSCPSDSLCVATDNAGHVVTTADPTGGAGAWTVTDVDGSKYLDGVSCASTAQCVAVDESGNVVTSTDPTGGAGQWSIADVTGGSEIEGVSCASTSQCVAVADGAVVTSTDPGGGAGQWTAADVDNGDYLFGVSCPSTSLCVATDDEGDVATSADPTGGSSAWTPAGVDGTDFPDGVSCPTTSLCVAVDSSGNVLTSADASDGSPTWNVADVDGSNGLVSVSCPSASLCVAVDQEGNVVRSTDPTGGAGAWSVLAVDGASGLYGVSCPSTALCVATDWAGDAVTSTDPSGGAGTWKVTDVDGSNHLFGISCPSTTLCVSTDWNGDVVTSTDPTGGAAHWSAASVNDGSKAFSVSCPSASLCVAADNAGDMITSTDPTGGPSAWTVTNVDGGTPIDSVSCSSDSQCIAVDAHGGAVTSTAPDGGAASWNVVDVDSANDLSAVSCPADSLCVAFDSSGDVLVGLGTPAVDAVSPPAGSTVGGTPVTVTGTGLTGATGVEFGGSAATVVGTCTFTTCDVLAPAGSTGPVAVVVTTPEGTSSSTAGAQNTYTYVAPASPEAYHPLAPVRICDTRSGQTKAACPAGATLGANGTVTVTAAGNGGVPASGATAVVVNVTVADTTSRSHLTVFPGGEPEPTASNLNWSTGQNVPNLVTVALSASGTFEAENFAGSADVIVDVEGYYGAGDPGQGLYDALATPARICDTRAGNPSGLTGGATQCTGLTPAAGTPLGVTVDGLAGVPSTGVGAVVLNVTAVRPTASGHLTVYPAGGSAPLASNVNYTAGEVVPNRVVVPVGTGGVVEVLSSAGHPDVLVDVAGWFTDDSDSSATGARFVPAVTPTRVCDTRSGLSYATPCAGETLGAGTTLAVTVAGADAVPADATAVVLNVTAADTTAASHLTVSPAGDPVPTVSDLNWTAGKNVPNLVIATVGAGGQVDLTDFAGSTDVIVDVVGWFVTPV